MFQPWGISCASSQATSTVPLQDIPPRVPYNLLHLHFPRVWRSRLPATTDDPFPGQRSRRLDWDRTWRVANVRQEVLVASCRERRVIVMNIQWKRTWLYVSSAGVRGGNPSSWCGRCCVWATGGRPPARSSFMDAFLPDLKGRSCLLIFLVGVGWKFCG